MGTMLILAAMYFCVARLGLMLDAVSGFATLVWPPTGIALAFLFIYGKRLWPGIAIGALLVNWSMGASFLAASGTALGNTLEAVLGAWLLRRLLGFDRRMERLQDVVGFAACAVPACTIVSATVGVVSLWLGGKVAAGAFGATWSAWWIGDLLGAMLFAPLIFIWGTSPRIPAPAGFQERLLLSVMLGVTAEVVFGQLFAPHPLSQLPQVYLIFLPLIWAALRTGQRGAVMSTLFIALLALWHTVHGEGPFARPTVSESLLFLQLFMMVVASAVMIMAAMMTERLAAEQEIREGRTALQRVNTALEAAVEQRTVKLTDLNRTLREEVGERQRVQEQLQRTNAMLVDRQQQRIEAMAKLEQANQELRFTQLQLIQSAKLESVGRLAAGVAHEVKNPLATLLIGIDHLSDHFPSSDKNIAVLLRDMDQAVKRADSVIRGMLDFSSPETLTMAPEDLNALIEQGLALVKHEMDRSHVTVERRLAPALPALMLDGPKMQQVFVNLFLNAVQAMPGGGTLTITTAVERLTTAGNGVGRRQTDRFKLGEPVVMAAIEDSGTGIPEEKLPNIFDPFFTTKPPGAGTGLGLTVTKKIIELHSGLIRVANRPGGGVQVVLLFAPEQGGHNGHRPKAHPAH